MANALYVLLECSLGLVMFSRVVDFCVKSCYLASFTFMLSLFRSYINITNRSSNNIDHSLTSLGRHRSSLKASFTSGKDL